MTTSTTSLVGRPLDRIDGDLKVTGRAIYAYEQPVDGTLYGVILGAGIARGRIGAIDTRAAEAMAGVRLVLTHRNAPAQPAFGGPRAENVFRRARPVLAADEIRHFDEPVALLVADSLEAARAAAAVIRIEYAPAPGVFTLDAAERYAPETINAGLATDSIVGDPEGAFAAAAVRLDVTYVTAFQHHAPMEPHAALAIWSGDELTVLAGTQTLANVQEGVAATLGLPVERVRVVSPFVGGGFGSKLIPHAEIVLAALAARRLGRPVKVAQTRQQMFANAGHRPMFEQRMRLGATADGRLVALLHDVTGSTARFEEFAEQTAAASRAMYAAPNRATRHRLARLDTNRGEWMRAPGEASGLIASECAIDELAERLGLDPIELRIRNEPAQDPERGVPFSTRALIPCMRAGAARFGWAARPHLPGQVREGGSLIGIGMAAAIRPNYLGPSSARVAIDAAGEVQVELDMTDIGTGTYTILAQIAADSLGVPITRITVSLGDTRFPRTAGSGGSWGAASAGSAVLDACERLKDRLGALAGAERGDDLALAIRRHAPDGLSAEGRVERGSAYREFSQHAYGAHFAEVAVDACTGEVRLRRMLGVFAAGRLLNPKTARSQIIGGMIWGVGAALLEEGALDPRYGQFVHADLANYHVPVQADIRDIEAVFLDEHDDKANPFGAKGIGELGICGAAAAIANAVHHATGARVRSFPITVDKLLPSLPDLPA